MEQVTAVTLLSNGVEVDGKVIDDYGLFSLKLTPSMPVNLVSEVALNGVVLPVGTVTDLLAEGMYLRDIVRQCAMYSKCDGAKAYKATFSVSACRPSDGFHEAEVIEYDIPLETKSVQECKKDGNLLFSRYPLGASEAGALFDEGVVVMPNDLPRFKYRLTKTTNVIGLGVQVYDDSATFDPNLDWDLALPPERQEFGTEFFYIEGNTGKLFVEVSSNAPFEAVSEDGTHKAMRTPWVNAPSRRLSPNAAYSIIVPAYEAGVNVEGKYARGSITVLTATGKAVVLPVNSEIGSRATKPTNPSNSPIISPATPVPETVVHKAMVDSKGVLLDLGLLTGNFLATGNTLYLTKTVRGVVSKTPVIRRARLGVVWGYCKERLTAGRYGVVIDGVSSAQHIVEVAVAAYGQYPDPSIFFEPPRVSVYATQVEGVNVMFKGENTIYLQSDTPVKYELEKSDDIMGGSVFDEAGMGATKIEFNTEGMKNIKLRVLNGKHTTPDEKDEGTTVQTSIWSVVDAEVVTAIITDVPTIATLFDRQFPVADGKAKVNVLDAAVAAGLPDSQGTHLYKVVQVNAVRIQKDDEIEPVPYTLKTVQGAGANVNGSYNVVSVCAEEGPLSEEPLPDIIIRPSSKWDKSIEAGQGVTVHHVVDESVVRDGYQVLKVDVRENVMVTKEGVEEQVTHEFNTAYGVHVFTLPDGCVPVKVADGADIIEGRVCSENETCACVALCDGKLLNVYLTTTSSEV